ncbi:MAG: cytochrome c-type biogenesis protein [Leptolinea sp.]
MSKFHLLAAASLLAIAGTVSLVWPAVAQQPTPSDDQVNKLAKEMYCPVCENTPLDVCPTQSCAQWRDLIRQKMQIGWSDQQIKDYFVAQYGDRVLSEPPARGLNWLIYILPPLFILGAAFILYRVLRKMKQQTASSMPAREIISKKSSDPYVSRMEEELNHYDKS